MSGADLEIKAIWWFQKNKYVDDGWTVSRTTWSCHPIYYLDALFESIFPMAYRSRNV